MRKHLPAKLGQRQLAELTTAELTTWRNGLVDLDGDEDEIRRSRDTANRLLDHGPGRVQPRLQQRPGERRSRLAPA